jgi:hypothetical protein
MQPYPFFPLEDSLLGQILCEIYSEKGKLQNLQSALQMYLKEGKTSFYFTPRTDKSTDLTILPPVFRKYHSENNVEAIKNKFKELLHPPFTDIRMDVVLELLEWVLTGIASNEISEELLKLLLGDDLVDSELIPMVIERYEKMVIAEL